MRSCWIILFLILSFERSVYAQVSANTKVSVTGKVKNAEKHIFLEGAVITILKPDSTTIVNYAISNAKGEFTIAISDPPEKYLMKVSMLGFKTEIVALSKQLITINQILLSPQVSDLKEVIVKPPKIRERNDTISYDVTAFSNVQDKTIGDVLKKMPGIDIQKDGTVLYNGKSINKFYIEGLDLLNNKYGIAVNNISPKDVKSVEVLEEHQPIKTLTSNMPTDRAALNLRLKESSKARWLGHVETAAGATPALWKADLLALNFSGKNQMMNILQMNNTGENIRKQLTVHTLEDYINGMDNQYDQTTLIKVKAENAPIADERSMLNQTFVFSTNNLRLLKNNYQLRTNFNLISERLKYFKNSVINYYSPTGTEERIIENNTGVSKQNQGNLEVNINKNTDQFYLNNKFSSQLSWNNTSVSTSGSNANEQESRVPYHFVENDFNFIKTYGKKKLIINSFNHFSFQPEKLGFSTVLTANPVNQLADHRDFTSHTHISLSTSLYRWSMEYRAGVKANTQRLNSTLEANGNVLPIQDSLTNHLYCRSVDYYGSASAKFTNEVMNFKISLPLHFYDNSLNNALTQETQNDNRLYLNPIASLNYKLTPKFAINARAELTTKPLGIDYLGEGYIYQTYRNLVSGNNRVNIEQRQNYALSLSYRSPVRSLFMALTGSYTTGLKNISSHRSFADYLLIERFLPLNNANSMWTASGRISKGLDNIDAVASITITYQEAKAELIQNDQLIKSNTRSVLLNPKFAINVSKNFNLEYTGSFNSSSLIIGNSSLTGALSSVQQSFLAGLIINQQINIRAGIDQLYNQLTKDQKLSAYFADFKVQYIPSKKITLELSLLNLFNNKSIAFNMIETASNTSSVYTIRPFNALISGKFTF